MEKYNKKRKSKKKNLISKNSLLDQITNSNNLSKEEKFDFLKYISSLSDKEEIEIDLII